MIDFFHQLNLNKKLALIAIVLAVTALIIGSPTDETKVTLNPNELALMISKGADHIEVEELADWIIQGKIDYRLLDLRDEISFKEYHIPTAENVQIENLMTYPIERNEKIILYSDGGIHSSQAWFLLKSKGFNIAYFDFNLFFLLPVLVFLNKLKVKNIFFRMKIGGITF